MRGQVGTPAKLTLDMESGDRAPQPGDFLLSEAGSAYEIQTAGRVRSERYPHRFRLRCLRFDPARIPADATVISFYWHPR